MSRSASYRTRSQNALPVREVTCSVHSGRPCQPCILCKQGNLSKYFHPKSWKNNALLHQLRELEPSVDIQSDSCTCICRPCRDDISKISSSGFVPRWRKLKRSYKHCLDVIVQLSPFSSVELRLLDIQALNSAFKNDPDLAVIPRLSVAPVMQVLFVCTGCDFVSFFNGLGKASFLNTLYDYCSFICSDSDQVPEILSNIDQDFLSFIRLVECTYFKKHKSAFLPTYPTPMTLFNSLANNSGNSPLQHSTWLEFLRERIWSKIKYEEEMIPSDDALERHWKRACWVINVWRQSMHNNIIYPPLDGNGWKQPSPSSLVVDWDSDENSARVRETVALLKKGCGCKTGCQSYRCKCKKGDNYCFGCNSFLVDCNTQHTYIQNSNCPLSYTCSDTIGILSYTHILF